MSEDQIEDVERISTDITAKETDDNGNILEIWNVDDFQAGPTTEELEAAEIETPHIRIKNIRLQNYMAFEDAYFDFTDKKSNIHSFCCFHGPNGCGKTTILNCIQTLFSKFDAYDQERLKANLGKSVRRVDADDSGIYNDSDFLITAEIEAEDRTYTLKLNKNGFVKETDEEGSVSSFNHPDDIKNMLYRICFFARFDMELDKFQLRRDKWVLFKDLFESVTGFEIEEHANIFNFGSSRRQNKIMEEYVMAFKIRKPNETISNRDCSAGERKIIKSFSTLLNKEYNPRIILVDNVAMHVESGRHLNLIKSMKRCFPDSQLFTTTHSYNISKNFAHRSQLYDLRFLTAEGKLKKDKWRIFLIDEIKEAILKIKSMCELDDTKIMILEGTGENLIEACTNNEDVDAIKENVKSFISEVSKLFIDDIISYHAKTLK